MCVKYVFSVFSAFVLYIFRRHVRVDLSDDEQDSLYLRVFFRQNPRSLIYFEFCEYLLWVQAIKVNSLVVSSKRIQRYERKLNICCGKQKLARTRSSKISS